MNPFRDSAIFFAQFVPEHAPDWLYGAAILFGIAAPVLALFLPAAAVAAYLEKRYGKH